MKMVHGRDGEKSVRHDDDDDGDDDHDDDDGHDDDDDEEDGDGEDILTCETCQPCSIL